jgi:hypothetical protein
MEAEHSLNIDIQYIYIYICGTSFLDELYLWHMHLMVSEHLEICQNTRNNKNCKK